MQKSVRFQAQGAACALPRELYVECAVSDEIEKSIRESLPVLPGLVPGLSDTERAAVFEQTIATSFVEFTLRYGDPFGCVFKNEMVTTPFISAPSVAGFKLPLQAVI